MTLPAPLRTLGRHIAPASYPENGYLTDGRRLFRVISRLAFAPGETFIELEDCRTLEVQAYAEGELAAMRLQRVDAAR